MTIGTTLTTDECRSAEPFTLPLGWRDTTSPAPGAHSTTVDHGHLSAGLSALAPDPAALPAVLLAAHLAVLALVTEQPSFQTDILSPPRHARPIRMGPGASSWRALVAACADAIHDASLPAATTPPAAGSPGPGRVVFQLGSDHSPPAADHYGLRVVAGPQALRLHVDAGAVSPTDLNRLAEMYRTVLATIAESPDAAPGQAPLPAPERDALLHRWSVGEPTERTDRSLLQLIEDEVDRAPEAIAVVADDGSLTYRELDRRANQLGHYLLERGVGPEDLVGVCLRRTLDLLPVLLGIWKAGAGFLPLDPDLPPERRQRMVRGGGCRLVLTTSANAGEHVAAGGAELPVERLRPEFESRPTTRPGTAVSPRQLAYVIYTSGSTGSPKGVMVEHRGLRNYLLWTLDAYASRGTGGSAYFTSISFDLGIPSLFTPLLAGQRVHLLADPLPLADLGELLVAGAPYSFLKLTPGHLHLLSLDLDPEQAHRLAGVVVAAGDAFPTELAERWQRLAGDGGTQVATEYGPTEITIGNSGQVISAPLTTELIPLGAPIPDTTMYVLTHDLRPVPVGVPGEVYIGGTGVARGYLGEPALTAKRFVPDPYGQAGTRLYRTGDRARWLTDGELEFLGRVDHQVKIRGYRVELGEIQAALHRHPTVETAVVIACRSPGRPARLAAFVVPAPGMGVEPDELSDALRADLPDYMVPADVVPVAEIPLTANGKVDTRALQGLVDMPTS